MAVTHVRSPDSPIHTLCGYGTTQVLLVAEAPTCKICLGRLYPKGSRGTEMQKVLRALSWAWARTPEEPLSAVFLQATDECSSRWPDDAELLKALEKYGGPK